MTTITKSSYFLILVSLILLAIAPAASALAEPPAQDSPASLSLIVLKITGDEYVMLKNNSHEAISDLSRFSLKAYNNYNPLVSNVSVTTQVLPAVSLGEGESLLLSSTIRPTCGASLAGKLSVSLVDGSGRLEIIQVLAAGASNVPEVIDSVSWSSTTAGEIKSVPSNTKSPLAIYYRVANNDGFAWQIAEINPIVSCQLKVSVLGASESTTVTVAPEDDETSPGITVEPVDMVDPAPDGEFDDNIISVQISEVLPNPSGTGNDTTDEFIELYNSNDSEFDLSGYQLQTGTTRLYNFTFKTGMILPAKSHTAFYSSTTGLTLSNTIGQARLLSPTGESVSATDVYRSAKDGQSWSLTNNVWSWSELTTPNALNVLQVPKPAEKKSTTGTSLSKKTPREPVVKKPKPVKAPKAPKPSKPKKINAEHTNNYSSALDKTLMERPIQTKLVATVGSVAVLYGAYEYRSSLANGIYKLRRKLGFGRRDRGQP